MIQGILGTRTEFDDGYFEKKRKTAHIVSLFEEGYMEMTI